MVDTQLGIHLLKPGVFAFQFGQAAVFLLAVGYLSCLPFVKGGRADLVLAAQIGYVAARMVLG